MKAVRYIVLAIVGLIVLAIAAIAVAMFVIDPNTYKPQIEGVVESKTNLDLTLSGDIGWSLFPLGLELNEVEATLEDEPFVALNQMIAELDFWSLISMSPQVHRFVLDGLDARLTVDENGNGNWTRIMPEGEASAGAGVSEEMAPAEQETAAPADGSGAPLSFAVDEIQITNANVRYEDLGTGQKVALQNFRLLASQIALGSEFPLEVGFLINTTQPAMGIDGDIVVRLTANEGLNKFSMSGLDAKFGLSGEQFGDKTLQARITGAADADLEKETATLEDFRATIANLELTANLDVEGFGAKPRVTGDLEVAEFSLRELMSTLGAEEIETTDPEVLNRLALSTSLTGPAGVAELSDLQMILDDTTFNGGARYAIDTGAVSFQLEGDALNVDRYLPPAAEGDQASTGSSAPASASNEGDLLPLDTIRGLDLDIDLGLGELIVSNLTITDIETAIDASGGQLKLSNLSGKLYKGGFQSNIGIDARTDTPAWTLVADVSGVQTQPLLQDLAEMNMLAGAANMNINANTSGNKISALRRNAGGQATFNLAEGQFTRMNLTRMACTGIAMANQEQLTTSDWGQTTPFNDMRGVLKINGNTLNNTSLVAALAGMRLEGNGTVDMAASEIDYEAGLRIVGEIHRDEACRVTEYVENVVIPVECRGNFTDDPSGLCSFDGSRFRDTLKDIAANAAQKKAKDEVSEKLDEKINEKLGEETGGKVKDALKGLFDR